MKILVIGGGNMGLTYANSIAANSSTATISILEKDPSKINELKESTSFTIYNSAENCISNSDIIMLAIKPQVAHLVFEEIAPFVKNSQLIISIMAGVTVETISKGLQINKIVRAMPNLPSQVGYGVTGYFLSEAVTKTDNSLVEEILGATGSITNVNSEDQIDAITSLSGSGPAYVFYFMNAMMEQAKLFGFSETDSKNVVLNTFLGTAKLFESSNINANTWMDRVTSKGGTTYAALTSFQSNEIEEKIKEGVKAAYNRAKQLSEN